MHGLQEEEVASQKESVASESLSQLRRQVSDFDYAYLNQYISVQEQNRVVQKQNLDLEDKLQDTSASINSINKYPLGGKDNETFTGIVDRKFGVYAKRLVSVENSVDEFNRRLMKCELRAGNTSQKSPSHEKDTSSEEYNSLIEKV